MAGAFLDLRQYIGGAAAAAAAAAIALAAEQDMPSEYVRVCTAHTLRAVLHMCWLGHSDTF